MPKAINPITQPLINSMTSPKLVDLGIALGLFSLKSLRAIKLNSVKKRPPIHCIKSCRSLPSVTPFYLLLDSRRSPIANTACKLTSLVLRFAKGSATDALGRTIFTNPLQFGIARPCLICYRLLIGPANQIKRNSKLKRALPLLLTTS